MAAYYEIGRYACKVVDQALGETGTGKPQFALRFLVLGMVDPQNPKQYLTDKQQYERTHYRVITDKTIPYFVEDLKVLGFHGESFRDLDPTREEFHDFRGLDIDMWCGHEPGQDGAIREKWGVARQGSTLDLKPLEAKKVRDLDNLFGKHLKSIGPNSGTRPPAAASSATVNAFANNGQITDDDIPF